MSKGYKYWTSDENEYVKNNWGVINTKVIAKTLNRSVYSVYRRVSQMGVTMTDEQYSNMTNNMKWTDSMEKYLKDNYGKIPVEEIMKTIKVYDVRKIQRKASYLGATSDFHVWTDEEVDYLETGWGTVSIRSMSRHLKVSQQAVIQKAHRMGLGNQLEASGDFYTLKLVAEMLGICTRTIYNWVNTGVIECNRLAVGKSTRVRVRYTSLIEFLKNNKSMYDTRYCDMSLIKSLLTEYSIRNENTITIKDMPDWLQCKIEHDNKQSDRLKAKSWTTKEEKRLRDMYDKNVPIKEICEVLNRTGDSVRGKIRNLYKNCN